MTRKDLIELALLLGRETKASLMQVMQLRRKAARYQRLCVEACNRNLTEKETRLQEKTARDIEALALAMGATGAVLGGDPRGCVVKIQVKSGVSTGWSNEGICVL